MFQVSDRMLKHAKHVYPFNTSLTKEAYYYRMIFEKHFPQVSPDS
jgi:asparagine synthase (glutamine-hydrolysing)